MNKTISLLLTGLMLTMLMAVSVSATRTLDTDKPIADFNVYRGFDDNAPNTVVVLTVNAGEHGYVVISVTDEDKYAHALDIARGLLGTEPTELNGTPFAYVRAEV